MGVIINGNELESMTHDGVEVQTWTHNGVEVYSAGKMVTYMVDSGVSYQEKVKKGQSCLAPTTFTPSKSGWAFVGWREDKAASGSVLGSKLMERSPITLYAVFRQVITLSYNGNGATGGSTAAQTGNRYYNNGNIANPSFTIRGNGFSRTSASFINWALNSISGTRYNAGSSITLSSNATLYARWNVTVNDSATYYMTHRYSVIGVMTTVFPMASMSPNPSPYGTLRLSGSNMYLNNAVASLRIRSSNISVRIGGYEGGDYQKVRICLYSGGTKIATLKDFATYWSSTTISFDSTVYNVPAGTLYLKWEGYEGVGCREDNDVNLTVDVSRSYEA